MNPSVSIIIVNYKSIEWVIDCISSIYKYHPAEPTIEIIVVDNRSEDDGDVRLKSLFPEVKWLPLPQNEGFGRANNAGINIARGVYLLLLNPDCVLVEPVLEKCLTLLRSTPDIGVLGCKLINPDGSDQKSTYRFMADYLDIMQDNLLLANHIVKMKRPIQAVMGAFMLIPAKVIKQCGGFDPDFFMYFEELELCYRIARHGYRIIYFDEATVIHAQGVTSGMSSWSLRQAFLSHGLFYLKRSGFLGYVGFHLLFLTNTLINFLLLWRMSTDYRKHYFRVQSAYFAILSYYIRLPFLFKKSFGDGSRLLQLAR